MVEILMPDGTSLSSIIANLNVFASDPATSKGAGEIIYQSGAGVLKVNTQTVNPTTNPTWTTVGVGGAGDFMADGSVPMTGNLNMNGHMIQSCNEIEFYNTSIKTGEIATFHGAVNETLFVVGADVIRIESKNGYDIVLDSGSGDIDADSNKIKNVLTPTTDYDGATKKYVDDNMGGAGDFMADGSVPMTGNLNMNGHMIQSCNEIQTTTSILFKKV